MIIARHYVFYKYMYVLNELIPRMCIIYEARARVSELPCTRLAFVMHYISPSIHRASSLQYNTENTYLTLSFRQPSVLIILMFCDNK